MTNFIELIQIESGYSPVELQKKLGWTKQLYWYYKSTKRKTSIDTIKLVLDKVGLSDAKKRKIIAQILD